MIRKILISMFTSAEKHNRRNILALAGQVQSKEILDLGCDDGAWTQQVARMAGAEKVYGIEIVPEAAEKARDRGVEVKIASLTEKLPYPDKTFDLVHSNQVIEHVGDIDMFASEAFRVLKPGGVFLVSTENGSSWHNICAAIMGWQIFSLTNFSKVESGIGNPLALHKGQQTFSASWTHKVIFNYGGLKDFLRVHGFTDITIKGAGYYPLPTSFASIDSRHGHFITARAVKAKETV